MTDTAQMGAAVTAAQARQKANKLVIFTWGGDLDKVWPTLILATSAAAMGMETIVFFTFWGLFPLVRNDVRLTGDNWMQKLLSTMHRGGTASVHGGEQLLHPVVASQADVVADQWEQPPEGEEDDRLHAHGGGRSGQDEGRPDLVEVAAPGEDHQLVRLLPGLRGGHGCPHLSGVGHGWLIPSGSRSGTRRPRRCARRAGCRSRGTRR